MHTAAEKERFVELRAAGLSYAKIAADLAVSKPTLISWAKEMEVDLANARAMRRDETCQQYAVAREGRLQALGHTLDAVLAELSARDLSEVKTEGLLKLALAYGNAMQAEAAAPPLFIGAEPDLSGNYPPVRWPA